MSDARNNSITTSNYSVTTESSYHGSKIIVRFNGICLKQDKITYTHRKTVNIYIVCEINKNYDISSYSTLENGLFGVIALIKIIDIDEY